MLKTISNNLSIPFQGIHPVVFFDNVFTPEQCNQISEMYNKNLDEANIYSKLPEVTDHDYRQSDVNFFNKDETNHWIFDITNDYLEQVNAQFFQFDLYGYDCFQYTEYNIDGKYDYHTDLLYGSHVVNGFTRKLSGSLILNDPSEYEGGKLEFLTNRDPFSYDQPLGRFFVFPSFMMHRVTPVISGVRKSLVVWVCGPHWR